MPQLRRYEEADRAQTICNACRYCEGSARSSRRWSCDAPSPTGDLDYLANLCHDCGACYHACQYAPPHEFAVNVPRRLGRAARGSLARYAWPAPLAGAFERNGVAIAAVVALERRGLHRRLSRSRAPTRASVAPGGAFYRRCRTR